MYFSSRLTSVSRRLDGGQLERQQFMGEVDSCLVLIQEGEQSPLPFTDCKSISTKKYLLWKFLICKLQNRLNPQIANPKSVTFAEGPQI
jgi:hypothetical protein